MKVAQKALHYFHAAISNHLSEKPKICLVLYGRLTQVYFIQDLDECVSSPCVGGQCVNVVGSFRCECPRPGFELDTTGRICLGK